MKLSYAVLIWFIIFGMQGCATAPRTLTVKSEPADAEVCIKGKGQSKVFSNEKTCIGSTPLEVDSVKITDQTGRQRTIHFNEIDSDKEQFYLVVSRKGYAPQSVTVPSWDQFVTLREEQANRETTLPKVEVPVFKADVAPAAVKDEKVSAKITSNPVGAVVYINDYVKGNTPYVVEGDIGQTLRLKIEQTGYRTIERSITFEKGRIMEINLSMDKEEPVAKYLDNSLTFSAQINPNQ